MKKTVDEWLLRITRGHEKRLTVEAVGVMEKKDREFVHALSELLSLWLNK